MQAWFVRRIAAQRGQVKQVGPQIFRLDPVGPEAEESGEPTCRTYSRCVCAPNSRMVVSPIIRRRRGLTVTGSGMETSEDQGSPKSSDAAHRIRISEGNDASFENVFLVDDFTASGKSYFRNAVSLFRR